MERSVTNMPAATLAAKNLIIPGASADEIENLVAALKRMDLRTDAGLKPITISLLGNVTTNYLADYIRLMMVRQGYAATIKVGEYGGLISGLLEGGELTSTSCDAAIVLLSYRDIQHPPPVGASASHARELVGLETDFWVSLLKRIAVPAAVLSFDLPPWRVLDEQDGLSPGGLGWHVKMSNLEIAARMPATISLVDAEALQARLGSVQWYDERLYHMCKQPYAMESLTEISHTLVAALMGLLGRSRKALVLDLDNTLWGGVIGDDGLSGIALGSETAEGEAFVAFQRYAKSLMSRGVILAVCSKNIDATARSPFREHSAMVLKEEDISCFVANFGDKAQNIRRIAKDLNIGLDSLVFVDDNPVERALIRAELPEVLVVELPEDPALYVRALDSAKAFPMRLLTQEDLGRAASYKAMTAVREAASGSTTDMAQFLSDLQPNVHVEKVDRTSVDRIVQLLKKTNQFKLNLSTFQEADILSAAGHVFALKLADRLQDYGIVAIAVTNPAGDTLEILNWVMSCRVFSRRLEYAMTELLCEHARSLGCRTLRGMYSPTEKNVIMPDILEKLGFSLEAPGIYHRPADSRVEEKHFMTIVDRRNQAS